AARAASEALPMRDAFAVLFFVSVGMLFDPMFLLEAPLLVLATLGVILIGKPLAAFAIVLYLRSPLRLALSVAVALAQIGEFSFILAALGEELHILPEAATNALIAAAIISISLNPILYRLIGYFEAEAKRRPRLWAWLNARSKAGLADSSSSATTMEANPRDSAIVVGYGPVGRTLVRLLQQNEIEPVVIELNLETVHRLRAQGLRAVYGDCTHQETVQEAGAKNAVAFLLTSSGMHGSEEAIRQVREANPNIRVFARATYLREVPELRNAGADVVFSGEGEVALTMTEFVLRQLGATDEQIDREKDRIRAELFGGAQTETPWISPTANDAPGTASPSASDEAEKTG
ncbi:MAG: NAD-binding protein, partial [Planctomycetaceae bacterium]|nr:NAD-binding protein [Planctomycetaceae bacterium]